MQRLELAKKVTSKTNQKTEQKKQVEESINQREVKGASLALLRNIFRIQYSDVYYVESKNSDNIYYFVKYNPSAFELCACPDNSTRHIKCKHLYAIEFAIRFGTLKDIDKLPLEAKRCRAITTTAVSKSLSYKEDKYSF